MRFRFCGDMDCPDWVLAEINTLSKMSSVKMKLMCIQVIKDLLGDLIDYDKVHKLTSDAKFEVGDVQATIAALNFIVSSAAKYNVDAESLANELQQLGLPKEHSGGVCKSYEESVERLRSRLRESSLRLSQLDSVEWRVDYVLSSSQLKEVNEPCVSLKLTIRNEGETPRPVSFTMTADKFTVFLSELRRANSIMENLVPDSS